MAKHRNFTDQFKAKVALEELRGGKTVQEFAVKHQLHPTKPIRNPGGAPSAFAATQNQNELNIARSVYGI